MSECKLHFDECPSLALRTSTNGLYDKRLFFGCKNYPRCSYIIPLHFNESSITENQRKLAKAFELFVSSNYFIYATFGYVYFNLRDAAFMDYLLKGEIITDGTNVEVGLTGAKIFDKLFHHLFLIPNVETRRYLTNNFPLTYESEETWKSRFFLDGVDYDKKIVDEEKFGLYKDNWNF